VPSYCTADYNDDWRERRNGPTVYCSKQNYNIKVQLQYSRFEESRFFLCVYPTNQPQASKLLRRRPWTAALQARSGCLLAGREDPTAC